MKTVLQIILLVLIILYMIFSSINFCDGYSKESISQFKSERNSKLISATILIIILYFCGTFSNIF